MTSLTQPTDSAPPSPLSGLLHSRKFLLMLMDVGLAIIGHFVGEYGAPAAKADIQFLTVTLQPVILFLIYTIADEDKARTRANADVAVAAHEARADIAVAEASQQQAGTPKTGWPPAKVASPWLGPDHPPYMPETDAPKP